jgi:hypothetical protein
MGKQGIWQENLQGETQLKDRGVGKRKLSWIFGK